MATDTERVPHNGRDRTKIEGDSPTDTHLSTESLPNRRTFLKSAITALAALGTAGITVKASTSEAKYKELDDASVDAPELTQKVGAKQKIPLLGNLNSLPLVVGERFCLALTQRFLDEVLRDIGIRSENAGLTKGEKGLSQNEREQLVDLLKRDPDRILAEAVFKYAIITPALEEFTFRYVVPELFGTREGMDWGLGIASSIAFGFSHNIHKDEQRKWTFDRETMPVSIVMGSLFYWYLAKCEGVSHAYVAHAFNNFLDIVGNREKLLCEQKSLLEGEELPTDAAAYRYGKPIRLF